MLMAKGAYVQRVAARVALATPAVGHRQRCWLRARQAAGRSAAGAGGGGRQELTGANVAAACALARAVASAQSDWSHQAAAIVFEPPRAVCAGQAADHAAAEHRTAQGRQQRFSAAGAAGSC